MTTDTPDLLALAQRICADSHKLYWVDDEDIRALAEGVVELTRERDAIHAHAKFDLLPRAEAAEARLAEHTSFPDIPHRAELTYSIKDIGRLLDRAEAAEIKAANADALMAECGTLSARLAEVEREKIEARRAEAVAISHEIREAEERGRQAGRREALEDVLKAMSEGHNLNSIYHLAHEWIAKGRALSARQKGSAK